jgi:lipoprotein NlpI
LIALFWQSQSGKPNSKGISLRASVAASWSISSCPDRPSGAGQNLYTGGLPRALADFNQASELDPKYAYSALWLDMAAKRSGLPSRLAEATAQIDMTKWPGPVIRLFLGQITPAAVLAAADNPNPETQKGQVCEANFFSGDLALQRGASAHASPSKPAKGARR